MSEETALGLTGLAMFIVYGLFVLWFMRYMANVLANLTGPRDRQPIVDEGTGIAIDPDDQIVGHEWVMTDTSGQRKEMRAISRGEQRVRYWFFLLVLPLTVYLHYRFWAPLYAGFEFAFDHLSPLIVQLFYEGSAQP